jgi:hypothetical protein
MLTTRDGLRLSGKIKIDTYRAGMVDLARPLLDELRELRKLRNYASSFRVGQIKQILANIKAAHFIATAVGCPNLIMDSPNYGLDLIIQRLVGINTYSLNILWIELGTGSTAPTVNDTGLTTPSVRAAVNFQEDYATTDAIVQAYITDANLPNATYQEVGGFVDGTASIGSGQIFNHSLLSPTYTKIAGQDTTIQIDVSVSNS